MHSTLYADILVQEGFQLIGRLNYRLSLTAWWNPQKLLQVIALTVGHHTLARGDKSYYLTSVTEEGETWARDIGLLHTYLEAHFPELRISFSHFRDLPAELAQKEVTKRMTIEAPTQPIPTVEQIAQLQRQLAAEQQDARSADDLTAMFTDSDLLTGYLHQQSRKQQQHIDQLEDQLERRHERLSLFQHLQREYQQKGSAAAYSFTVSSNIQVAENPQQFQDVLRAVVKELTDLNRYQVMQKLGGGRLNIQVAEATEPVMVWIEQWLGGALTPKQMRRLSADFDQVRQAAEQHLIVTPDEPIVVDGHVRHAEKHLSARFVSTVMQHLDKTDEATQKAALSPDAIPVDAMPLALGRRLDDSGRLTEPVAFPLAQLVHVFVSGTTGGGKSFLARVLIEEAAEHRQLNILVLDPRNQSIGTLIPEDRPKILQQYEPFEMKPEQARGFSFDYCAPGLPYAPPLPDRLPQLAHGRHIVSFKGLDDARRCKLAGRVLDAAFEAHSSAESDRPRLLVLVDEAQLLTRKRVDESSKQAAAHAERAIDKIAREGRKFGIVLVLVSQTIRDFGYELASIRQMTTTKIFLRNSDREIEYASDVIGDGRLLVQLATGTALVHNANWGVVRIRIRPPYSKVFELGETEVRRLVGTPRDGSKTLTAAAQHMLAIIRDAHATPANPLNMSRLATLAGISSKRRLIELIDELTEAGTIYTRTVPERGRPRIIELISQPSADTQR